MKAIRYIGACLLVVACGSVSTSQELDVEALQSEIFETIEQVRPAVVSISRGGSMFSGVIVSKTGHVLSAAHAVQPGADYRIILPDGRRFRGKGKGSNPQADCALIQITDLKDKEIPYAQMGESSTLVANQPVLSLAFPGGQGTRSGPLVRFGRYLRGSRSSRPTLQSTALMEPGDSGGPLFDLDGRVIGIHSRISTSMSRNYEVPIDVYREYWNELNADRVFTQAGMPPLPMLGIYSNEETEPAGLRLTRVVPRSIASIAKLQVKDLLTSVYDKDTPDIKSLREALAAARDEGAKEIELKVVRGEEELTLKAPFDVQREPAPDADFPDYEEMKLTEPVGYKQLASLARQFSDMESDLDDFCVNITSDANGKSQKIIGTLVEGSDLLISKNSMVAENPIVVDGEEEFALEVVERDTANDLVLLRLPKENTVGIELAKDLGDGPLVGRFLLTPDPVGSGIVSVWSTVVFKSEKQRSYGYLGVRPRTHEKNQGAYLESVDQGAAKRAGLKTGDIIKKMNDTEITTHLSLVNFLRKKVEANMTVVATILRGEEELEKTITLGSAPPSRHAADVMKKSFRRDGFSSVISHDADLRPEKCGGPIFDLEGNFIGLNIARNSRVRSYAIPRALIKEFVSKHVTSTTDGSGEDE